VDDSLNQAFRRAMGAFATGVAVITARRDDGVVFGITVNSLTSVSLLPPLLLWCLGDSSERYDIFAGASAWGVNILGADDEALARRYAVADDETVAPNECELLADTPVLRAGVAHFACRTHLQQQAGDHLILIGEVMGVRQAPGDALTFFRGGYGRAVQQTGSD